MSSTPLVGCFIRRLGALRLTMNAAAAALPVPTVAGDGFAVPVSWKVGPNSSRYKLIAFEIIGNPLAAVTITGLAVYGYDGTTWWKRATYGDLTIDAGGPGATVFMNDIAADERIAIAATITAPVNVFAVPYISESFA